MMDYLNFNSSKIMIATPSFDKYRNKMQLTLKDHRILVDYLNEVVILEIKFKLEVPVMPSSDKYRY